MRTFLFLVLAATIVVGAGAQSLPRLSLADFTSSSMEKGKLALVTEAFRSELFKTGLFSVQDQPWVPGTKPTNIEKAASGTVEAFGTTWVVNVKVADLGTGALDFSETSTVADESQLFKAVKELTAQLATRFRYGVIASQAKSPEERARLSESQWKGQGAEGTTLTGLIALGESTENYLTFRQYDGTISPEEYLDMRKQNVDLETLRTFLQAGISYRDARKALSMGITRLEKYQISFKPANFEFSDYLEAYSLGFSTSGEYKRYLAESERDFVSLGLGGVANALPVGTANFKFFSGQAAWEHSWSKNPKDVYRINTEAGFLLLNMFLPVPYGGIYVLAGQKPFFFKAGVGGVAEMLIGSHLAVHFRLGLEVASRFEVTLMAVPFGTEPVVNYANFQKWTGPADGPIKFPYFGLFFTYKIPISGS